ncbi:hypothetical protein CDAR_84131 [Caerostris darwini]|uniref:Uncharacterized protein n=1 Tax=Caerostris darwini TaxID=1538125 RepID=A0AAV4U660_9ARAC|nr:hypothetical protein CDAR_84131 [Caerostris darwini]
MRICIWRNNKVVLQKINNYLHSFTKSKLIHSYAGEAFSLLLALSEYCSPIKGSRRPFQEKVRMRKIFASPPTICSSASRCHDNGIRRQNTCLQQGIRINQKLSDFLVERNNEMALLWNRIPL